MATTDNAGTRPVSAEERWYALEPEEDAPARPVPDTRPALLCRSGVRDCALGHSAPAVVTTRGLSPGVGSDVVAVRHSA